MVGVVFVYHKLFITFTGGGCPLLAPCQAPVHSDPLYAPHTMLMYACVWCAAVRIVWRFFELPYLFSVQVSLNKYCAISILVVYCVLVIVIYLSFFINLSILSIYDLSLSIYSISIYLSMLRFTLILSTRHILFTYACGALCGLCTCGCAVECGACTSVRCRLCTCGCAVERVRCGACVQCGAALRSVCAMWCGAQVGRFFKLPCILFCSGLSSFRTST